MFGIHHSFGRMERKNIKYFGENEISNTGVT
jgi:hypothetical protein